MKPKRIQLSRRKGFNLLSTSIALNGLPVVNCARPGEWGNPFIVGEHGTAQQCVENFRTLLAGRGNESQRRYQYYQSCSSIVFWLKGKNLACWCAPDAPCHCDVLLDIANR